MKRCAAAAGRSLAPQSSYRPLVCLLMLLAALGHFNRVGMSVAGAERILAQYGLAPTQMGKVYSAFLLCYTLAMLPGGWLLDRFGPRRMLTVYAFGSALFVALTGCVGLLFHQAQSVWLGLVVVRSLLGAVNAPLHPSAARMVFQRVPASARSSINGLVIFAICPGIAATYYGLGKLIDLFDWPIAFLLCGGLTLAIAAIWAWTTREEVAAPTAAPPADSFSLLRALGRRSVICLTLSYGLLGYFQYMFFYWIEYYFETIQRQGVDAARGYTTLIVMTMGAGMACGGWLTDRTPTRLSPRLGRGLVPALGMTASGLIFELGLLSADPQFTLIAFALAAAFLGACEGGFWTTVVELGGRFGGTAGGLMNTGGNVGGTLSPYLTPLLGLYFAKSFGDELGWRMSLAVAGAAPLLGALLWCGVDPTPEANA